MASSIRVQAVVTDATPWLEMSADGKTINKFKYTERVSPSDILIPASIGGVTIEAIANGAFAASNLTTIEFASGSALQTIGSKAFFNNPLTTIDIPATVTSIENNAFEACENLTTVKMPRSLISWKTPLTKTQESSGTVKSDATIVFVYSGGLDEEGFTAKVLSGEPGASYTVPEAEYTGHIHTGWSQATPQKDTQMSILSDAELLGIFPEAGSVTVYIAQWTALFHTVMFLPGEHGTLDGQVLQLVSSGKTVMQTPIVTADPGYVFIGWEINSALLTRRNIESINVSQDLTIIAIYVPSDVVSMKWSLVFEVNGGLSVPQNVVLVDGMVVDLTTLVAIPPAGKIFAGWSNAPSNGIILNSVTMHANQTVYAQYADDPATEE